MKYENFSIEEREDENEVVLFPNHGYRLHLKGDMGGHDPEGKPVQPTYPNEVHLPIDKSDLVEQWEAVKISDIKEVEVPGIQDIQIGEPIIVPEESLTQQEKEVLETIKEEIKEGEN